jgi:hypothetical protein
MQAQPKSQVARGQEAYHPKEGGNKRGEYFFVASTKPVNLLVFNLSHLKW